MMETQISFNDLVWVVIGTAVTFFLLKVVVVPFISGMIKGFKRELKEDGRED